MSAPIDLNLVRAFVQVHETGSFSAAATKLRVPRSTVSRAVSALEESTGLLLFHRTTRKVTTTRAGIALFDRVQPSLVSLEASLHDLPGAEEKPTGLLRITASADLGHLVFAEAVARYTARYPETSVEVQLSPKTVDLAKDGFDLALRWARGPLPGAALVTRSLGNVAFHLFAAPLYVSQRGLPRHVDDLAGHTLVALGTTKNALPSPRVVCDDKLFARELLRRGGGIGLLPSFLGAEDVAEGRLVRVLPSFEVGSSKIHLVTPSKKLVPVKVTAFRELLLEMLRQRPLG